MTIDYCTLISRSLFTFHQLNTLHIFAPLDNNVPRIARLAARTTRSGASSTDPLFITSAKASGRSSCLLRGGEDLRSRRIVLTRGRGGKGNSVEKKKDEEEEEEEDGLKLHRR